MIMITCRKDDYDYDYDYNTVNRIKRVVETFKHHFFI